MAAEQPTAATLLSNPSHSLLHRVMAVDALAPVKSAIIDSNGYLGLGTETPDRKLHVEVEDATTDTIINLLRLSRFTSGTSDTGCGVGLEFETENAYGDSQIFRIAASNVSNASSHDLGQIAYIGYYDPERIELYTSIGIGISYTKLASHNLIVGDGLTGYDVSITFDGETNDGLLTWMEDEDYLKFSDDILMNSTERLYFRDTAINIYSANDGYLDLTADTQVRINAATDIVKAGTQLKLSYDATDFWEFAVDTSKDMTIAGGLSTILKLGDTAGAEKLIIQDSSGAEQGYWNSDGGLSTKSISIKGPTPMLGFYDTDAVDGDQGGYILFNCPSGEIGAGVENLDVTMQQRIAGTLTSFFVSDADGDITLGNNTRKTKVGSLDSAGLVTIKPASASTDPHQLFSLTDLTHAITDFLPTDCFLKVAPASATMGGVILTAATEQESSSDTSPFTFRSIRGSVCGGDDEPAFTFDGGIKSGTGYGGLSSEYDIVQFKNAGVEKLSIEYDGSLCSAGDIYSVAWVDYSGTTLTGWSGSPTKTIQYKKIGKLVFVSYSISGTSDATSASFTVPYNIASENVGYISGIGADDGNYLAEPTTTVLVGGGSIVSVWKNVASQNWTASGLKIVRGQFWYEVA